MSLAENIKKQRMKKGLSQDQVSKIADVTYTTYAKIESGANDNPTIKTIQKIAKALDITIDELVGRKNKK